MLAIEDSKTAHQAALSAEKAANPRYQEQLNHWMAVVDDERRNKQQLEKQLAESNQQHQALYKEQLELQARLDFKSKAYLGACETRNQLQKVKQHTAPLAVAAGDAVPAASPETLMVNLSDLQAQAKQSDSLQQQFDDLQQRHQQLNQQLQQSQQKLDDMNQMALELERLKGAAEAFEKSLAKQSSSL